ncbi:zinc ribbon domain-containing protein [Blastopirellula marina]|uniref:Zinc ribbon domain-containing protein n=1 Tax=Blastopirellula marina TaxID=124 RepID=A0A2S8GEL0_9BACT|nr:zinc ribbon domain-containing protein [Blastopirellula marina]PQO42853.1 zinc ribbon domain-containing protein [Blastopirellula marina]PTL46619.1 zinc ribbon domain-containing protein [Blastopirellula marina]
MATTPCRDCGNEVSFSASICPKCGAPEPYNPKWDGYGYEYKSKATLFGLPLVHISFKYRRNCTPVVANGVIAIGQFAFGIVSIAQFGMGVVVIGQFTFAAATLAQFAVAAYAICQMGAVYEGIGQRLFPLDKLL